MLVRKKSEFQWDLKINSKVDGIFPFNRSDTFYLHRSRDEESEMSHLKTHSEMPSMYPHHHDVALRNGSLMRKTNKLMVFECPFYLLTHIILKMDNPLPFFIHFGYFETNNTFLEQIYSIP